MWAHKEDYMKARRCVYSMERNVTVDNKMSDKGKFPSLEYLIATSYNVSCETATSCC